MIAGVQNVVPRPLETGMSDGHSARWGFSLVELLVSLGVISTLLGFIAPAIQASRESSRRLQCLNHMRQFAVAEHSFESAHGHFPEVSFGPSDNIGLVSRAILSHHYSLLPYLDQTATFQQVDVSAGLQSSLNTPPVYAGASLPNIPLFHCPSDIFRSGCNSLRVCAGTSPGLHGYDFSSNGDRPLGGFGVGRSRQASEFTDGQSNTIMLSERVLGDWDSNRYEPFRDIAMQIPGDFLTPDEAAWRCRDLVIPNNVAYSHGGGSWLYEFYAHTAFNNVLPPNSPIPDCSSALRLDQIPQGAFSARSLHRGGVNVAFVDGSARFISESISLNLWRGLASASGNEPHGNF